MAILAACGAPDPDGVVDVPVNSPMVRLSDQQAGTAVRLQAVSVVDRNVAWLSGTEGTYAVTTDGGLIWAAAQVPGAEELEFRDVHATSADHAILLASGPGEMSRVLVTQDRGSTWSEAFRNLDPDGFFNCFDFEASGRGWLVGDSRDGRIPVLVSADGLEWSLLPSADLPVALEGEAGFSASGTCIEARSEVSSSGFLETVVLLGTGGGGVSRVHRGRLREPSDPNSPDIPEDRTWPGVEWEVTEVPVPSLLSTAGVASVVSGPGGLLAVGGGDVAEREKVQETVALRGKDGAWQKMPAPRMPAAIFGLAWSGYSSGGYSVSDPSVDLSAFHWVDLWAAGPGGLAVTRSLGSEWTILDGRSYWAVGFAPVTGNGEWSGEVEDVVGWAVGPDGRVTRLTY